MIKSIVVYSNDPDKRHERLTIEASIRPLFKFVPSGNVKLEGKQGEIKSADIFISAGQDKPLKIEPGGFTLEGKLNYSLEMVEEGKQYKITFSNNPDISGSLKGELRLKTNYKEKPHIKIRVNSRFR